MPNTSPARSTTANSRYMIAFTITVLYSSHLMSLLYWRNASQQCAGAEPCRQLTISVLTSYNIFGTQIYSNHCGNGRVLRVTDRHPGLVRSGSWSGLVGSGSNCLYFERVEFGRFSFGCQLILIIILYLNLIILPSLNLRYYARIGSDVILVKKSRTYARSGRLQLNTAGRVGSGK